MKMIFLKEGTKDLTIVNVGGSVVRLDDYYKLLECECIDMPNLDCPSINSYCMICDDSGLLNDRKITYRHGYQAIAGSILFTKVNNCGECIDLDNHDIGFLMNFIKYVLSNMYSDDTYMEGFIL